MSTQPRKLGQARFFVFGLAVILLVAACSTPPQGTTAAVQSSAGSAPMAKEVEPAPVSKSYPPKKEVFQGAEYSPAGGIDAAYPNARQVRLRAGEVVEVFHGSWAPGDGQLEMAFYLPPEAASVAQLVVESKGFAKTYFVRGLAPGETVGGVVERRWLDFRGYRSKDLASEARIQAAVKQQPVLFFIE